jgi:tetratricopeptide (TPR) repeat protein
MLLFLLFTTLYNYAHGSLSIRIEEKSKEIAENPKDGKLYFERGYLYQQHYEYNKAIKDFLKSNKLKYSNKELHFVLAETYYLNGNYKKALKSTETCFSYDATDVNTFQLQAKIQFKLELYQEAIESYNYVIAHKVDLSPKDIIEYTSIILAVDNSNYTEAINAIDIGLSKIGEETLTLQLKKLDYLIASNQSEAAINQYNYFISSNTRKEFWYLKKAIYLKEINRYEEANIALQQAKLSISVLKPKFQNTLAVKDLQSQINELEKSLML